MAVSLVSCLTASYGDGTMIYMKLGTRPPELWGRLVSTGPSVFGACVEGLRGRPLKHLAPKLNANTGMRMAA
jgi:hypothetical protein